MAVAKSKSRAKQFQDPDELIAQDHDPEANGQDTNAGSDSDASEDANAGTEHYQSVGKSKLRQKESVSLGPQYRGSRVTRKALDEESEEEDEDEEDSEAEFDDPALADLEADEAGASDSEIESDDALNQSDEERFKDYAFRGSSKPTKPKSKHGSRAKAADYMSSDEDAAGGAGIEDDEDDLEDSDEDDDMSDGLSALIDGEAEESNEEGSAESDEGEDEEDGEDDSGSDDGEDGKSVIRGSRSTATPGQLKDRSDVDKGEAIQQQRKIYDGLLNIRIRLQKALVAANTFSAIEDGSEPGAEPYEAAEEAAIKLLNTISTLKSDFAPSSGMKRKRADVDTLMPSEKIWDQLQAGESQATKFRDEALERWSRKVQTINVLSKQELGSRKKTLVDTLEEQLHDPSGRLTKRTRTPRSCAPAQAAKRVTDADIYDDADFYQQLLKELVEQRTVDGNEDQASAVPTVMLTAAKDAKMRKNVDRKASKGRKMRFTVHEKLQNFMAPEDRRAWDQSAIDRFFGTLFGQRLALNEDASEDEEMDGLTADTEGVRLFG